MAQRKKIDINEKLVFEREELEKGNKLVCADEKCGYVSKITKKND